MDQGQRTTFINRHEVLEKARVQLKEEFIGIDEPIDLIINQMKAWYLMSEMQERPFIINLWGLTGVGKTSLVNRLMEIIDYNYLYFRVDLGNKSGEFSLNKTLESLCSESIDKPVVISLDEFQHTRTLNSSRDENVDENRILWELIDTGIIQYSQRKVTRGLFQMQLKTLLRLIQQGVIIEKGKVVKRWELYANEYGLDDDKDKRFVSENLYKNIVKLTGWQLHLFNVDDLAQKLFTLNTEQTFSFLTKVIQTLNKPIERNFSKSLIFILGNLDEAYQMSNDFSADVDADEYYQQTQKINVSAIKEALKSRFRNEQISRLGNIHVIYPALSKKAYQGIIKKELESISEKFTTTFDIPITFETSVANMIYEEGVIPTQGVRPLLTTINQLVRSYLSDIIMLTLKRETKFKNIRVTFDEEGHYQVFYSSEKEKDDRVLCIDISKHLKRFQINTKDNLQCITAVHESGHAILSFILMGNTPKHIYSRTVDHNYEGSVFTRNNQSYLSKNEIVKRAAIYYGGIAAEEIVFGEEHLTTGSGSDIEGVTQFVLGMLKKEGMGSYKARFKAPSTFSNYAFHEYRKVEEEAENILIKAYTLAKSTLEIESHLLIKLSKYLSEHSHVDEKTFAFFVESYAKQSSTLRKENYNYKLQLESKYQQLIDSQKKDLHQPIILNKNVN